MIARIVVVITTVSQCHCIRYTGYDLYVVELEHRGRIIPIVSSTCGVSYSFVLFPVILLCVQCAKKQMCSNEWAVCTIRNRYIYEYLSIHCDWYRSSRLFTASTPIVVRKRRCWIAIWKKYRNMTNAREYLRCYHFCLTGWQSGGIDKFDTKTRWNFMTPSRRICRTQIESHIPLMIKQKVIK